MSRIINSRGMGLTAFVRARDVERALGCSRSTAFEHLRRAAGRTEGTGALLRVPLETWEAYVRASFGPAATPAAGAASLTVIDATAARPRVPATSVSRATPCAQPPIAITRPRIKKS